MNNSGGIAAAFSTLRKALARAFGPSVARRDDAEGADTTLLGGLPEVAAAEPLQRRPAEDFYDSDGSTIGLSRQRPRGKQKRR